jgi:WD repeat-containing protein 68
MAWNRRPTSHQFRMAVSSYKEEYSNQIHIIQRDETTQSDNSLVKISEFEHPYPATKLMWAPPSINASNDMIATTGDYLRLWNIDDINGSVLTTNVLNNNKHTEYCAPLTSFDWNETEPSMIGTCSIDTTCTIWDVNRMTPKTQLMAHDKEDRKSVV